MPKDHWEGTKLNNNSYVRFIETFEFVWTKDFYQYFFKKGRLPLTMTIDIYGRPMGAQGAKAAIGYVQIDLNSKTDGKINYGFHVL
jgi:hypothetical protein